MNYEQGDIILLPYPYTDLSNAKQRPAVIISKEAANQHHSLWLKLLPLFGLMRSPLPFNQATLTAN